MKLHGSEPGEYGAVLLSAVRFSKQKRRRENSLIAPTVTDSVASEPSAMAREAAAQSSTSIVFTRVVVRAKTERGGPAIQHSRSWAWIACVVRVPPSSVFQRPRHGLS